VFMASTREGYITGKIVHHWDGRNRLETVRLLHVFFQTLLDCAHVMKAPIPSLTHTGH